MGVDFDSLSDVLKHPIRRRVILALYERNGMSYVDLMNLVEATNTGKFNYHLKILGDLIEKDQNGKYGLSDKGQLTAQFLQKFPEKKAPLTPLHVADAVLIGFVGVVLTVANPAFWSSFLIALLSVELPMLFLISLSLLVLIFALILPGAIMWFLTVRRAHSHDAYDLFKPPFVTFILLLLLLIAIFLLGINLTVTIKTPTVAAADGGSSYSLMQTSLSLFMLFGLAFSFLGVAIAEFASRIRKRIMP